MEALAIFGIVCNVMQTIDFSCKLISTYKRYQQDGSADGDLHEATGQMRDMAKGLQQAIEKGGRPYTEDETKLLDTATRCTLLADKLSDLLDGLKDPAGKGIKKYLTSVKLTVKRNLKKSSIEDLEKNIGIIRSAMNTRLIIRLCNQQSAMELQQQECFERLDRRVQAFVNHRANNDEKLIEYFRVQADSIKQNTSMEANKIRDLTIEEHQKATEYTFAQNEQTRDHLGTKLNDLQIAMITKSDKEKLLKSLNYIGRDQRFNDIKEPFRNTFEWLFGDELQAVDSVADESPRNNSQERFDEEDIIYEAIVEESRKRSWDSFATWLKSTQTLYWIKGKPGAGKSTLMKFLCTDSRTKSQLQSETTCIVISHFFWLAGSPMQCNIKGMLSSLLYQLLCHDKNDQWVSNLCEKTPSLQLKEDHLNWSEQELRNALKLTIKLASEASQIILFIDGLDEVKESDGKVELLKLLTNLRTTYKIKMCVSSRLEAEFNRDTELATASSLSLHDLTVVDMYLRSVRYLLSLTEPLLDHKHKEEHYIWCGRRPGLIECNRPQYLAAKITKMSQGVFLWSDLIIRSLERGLNRDETWSELQHRFDIPPGDLNRLYASMWERLGDDTKIYQEEASFYLNMILDWNPHDFRTRYECKLPEHQEATACTLSQPRNTSRLTLYHLALAKHLVERNVQKLYLNDDVGDERYATLFRKLPILSAGLLEFQGQSSRMEYNHPDIEVGLIHRTARDFLLTTSEGQTILRFDKSIFEVRFRCVLTTWMSRALAHRPSVNSCFRFAKVNIDNVCETISYERYDKPRIDEKVLMQLLDICQLFHEKSIIVRQDRFQSDFLGIAARHGFRQYVLAKVEQSRFTTAYNTYLLVCASFGLRIGKTYKLLLHLELIDNLLSAGYDTEPQVIPGRALTPMDTCKATLIEVFMFGLNRLYMVDFSHNIVELHDLIFKILRELLSNEAFLFNPICGIYFRGLLCDEGTEMVHRAQSGRRSTGRGGSGVLVEWTILDFMFQKFHLQFARPNTYRHRELQELLADIQLKYTGAPPKIICIAYNNHRGFWTGIRLSNDEKIQLSQTILKSLCRETDVDDKELDIAQAELDRLIHSIVAEEDELEDLTELFCELGFHQTWPRYEVLSIVGEHYTKVKPENVIYPPIKYLA